MNKTTALDFCWDPTAFKEWPIYEQLSRIVNGPILLFIAITGCVGNVHGVLLVTKFRISKALRNYLITLLVWDCGVLISGILFYCTANTIALLRTTAYTDVTAYLMRIMLGVSATTMCGSIWMVVAITVARYIAISYPFVTHAGSTTRWSQRVCLGLSMGAIIFTLPAQFELELTECTWEVVGGNNTTMALVYHAVFPTNLRLNEHYSLIYRVILYSSLVSVGPFLVVLILTLRMILTIRASAGANQRRETTSRSIDGTNGVEKPKNGNEKMTLMVNGNSILIRSEFESLHTDERFHKQAPILINIFSICLGILSIFPIILITNYLPETPSANPQHRLSVVSLYPSGNSSVGKTLHQSNNSHTTNMLLMLLGKFLVSNFLPTLLNIVEHAGMEGINNTPVFVVITHFNNFIVIVNSATNFLVYIGWRDSLSGKSQKSKINMGATEEHRSSYASLSRLKLWHHSKTGNPLIDSPADSNKSVARFTLSNGFKNHANGELKALGATVPEMPPVRRQQSTGRLSHDRVSQDLGPRRYSSVKQLPLTVTESIELQQAWMQSLTKNRSVITEKLRVFTNKTGTDTTKVHCRERRCSSLLALPQSSLTEHAPAVVHMISSIISSSAFGDVGAVRQTLADVTMAHEKHEITIATSDWTLFKTVLVESISDPQPAGYMHRLVCFVISELRTATLVRRSEATKRGSNFQRHLSFADDG